MNDSLGGYIDKLLNEVAALQEAVSELRTENREMKDMPRAHLSVVEWREEALAVLKMWIQNVKQMHSTIEPAGILGKGFWANFQNFFRVCEIPFNDPEILAEDVYLGYLDIFQSITQI